MTEENYSILISAFKKLDTEDKKEEIIKKLYEFIKLLYLENKKIDSFNVPLGIISDYHDDDSYYDFKRGKCKIDRKNRKYRKIVKFVFLKEPKGSFFVLQYFLLSYRNSLLNILHIN